MIDLPLTSTPPPPPTNNVCRLKSDSNLAEKTEPFLFPIRTGKSYILGKMFRF